MFLNEKDDFFFFNYRYYFQSWLPPGYGASMFMRRLSPRLSEKNNLFVLALK